MSYKFQAVPIPGVLAYIQLMRNDVLVNPPDLPGHVPATLREANHILLPIFASLFGLDVAASSAPPADVLVYGKPNVILEFSVASLRHH